jgi:hypothetical protein
MRHVLPESEARPLAYAEAVSRLASIRHALRLVEPFGAGPASDDDAIAAAWNESGKGKQRLFDHRTERLVGATTAGLDALLIERREGHEPNPEATQAMVHEIRRELRDVAGIVLA